MDDSTRMLNIMTSKPIVTIISSVKLNQPITMALVPTPAKTLPLPRSCAIMAAATEAVCCHSTDTRTNMDAMKMMASAIWLTGLLGKGLMSRSEPSESSSSCQPGNVASSRKQMKAKMMAMILLASWLVGCHKEWRIRVPRTYIRYGNTIISLNWLASQIKFNGSCSTDTSFASEVALLLHSHEPPSGLTQIPKYPTLAWRRAVPTILLMAALTL
jgi:hypothetical protein